jgi:hypothetical protein
MKKEQISELCNFVFEDSPFKPNGWVSERITEWFEQNPTESIVVGLTDEQVRNFYRKSNKSWDREGVFVSEYRKWAETETFTQPQPQSFQPNWDDAPEWANYYIIEASGTRKWYERSNADKSAYFGKEQADYKNKLIFKRPKPLAPKVAEGKYFRKHDEFLQEVDVLHIGDMVVNGDYLSSVVFNINGTIRTMTAEDFLAKFERVGGSE